MWRELFDAAGEFNTARVVLLSSWSWAIIVAVAAVALAVIWLAWHNVGGLAPRRRRILLGLRVSVVAVLLVLFLEPGVRLEHVSRVRNHVVFAVDGSRSMSLPGGDDATRLGAVQAALQAQASLIEAWRGPHQVDFYALSDRARPVADPSAIEATGDATRILSALDDLSTRLQPEDLAAVILISDGADTAALGEAVRPGEAPPPVVRDAVARLGAPLHVVFTGPDHPPRDVAISDVAYDEFAFVHNVVSIEAKIKVTGYEDLNLPVTLRRGDARDEEGRRGDALLGQRILGTRAGQDTYRLEFEFVPDQTGKWVFTLEIGAGPGEQIRVNNRRQFVIRVIRDKIRVLQVVGRPSWDERFLRKLLKKNPNVDLISFFILRTATNLMLSDRDELSLIPFPTKELFEEQLGSFDLIVFQNFTYRGYAMEQYLPLIRNYVHEGGGFVMVGGDLSFSAGGFAGTPIAEFLPLRLPTGGDLIATDRFKARLTEIGRHHPITALSLAPEDNAAAWESLPELTGANRVLGAKAWGTVLLEHPTRRVGGQPEPVVAAGIYGEGRVLAVTTDTTWRWDFRSALEGGDNRHYYKFWGNAIRWLIKDPALQALRVEADRERYPLGAEITLVARVLGRDYSRAPQVPVRLEVERTGTAADGTWEREVVLEREGQTNGIGELLERFKPSAEGAYRVVARATLPGGAVTDEDVFVVAADPVELRHTEARRETLQALVTASGGTLLELKGGLGGLADLERREPRVVKVNRRRDVAVWARWPWLLLALLLPSAEWFWRRRWGLL